MFESLIGNCHVSPYMPVLYVRMKFCMVRPTRLLHSTVLLPVGHEVPSCQWALSARKAVTLH